MLIVALPVVAELSLGAGGRIELVAVSLEGACPWLSGGVVMVIVLVGISELVASSSFFFGLADIPPMAKAASISLRRCSNRAFFFFPRSGQTSAA